MKRSLLTASLLGLLAAGVLLFALLRSSPAQARPVNPETEPYRVELVANDVYLVQKALNANAAKGWWYSSAVTRSDGKLLLIFRAAQ
jgi:hypothetical protein